MDRLMWQRDDLINLLRASIQAGQLASASRSDDYLAGWMEALHLIGLQLGFSSQIGGGHPLPPRGENQRKPANGQLPTANHPRLTN